MAFAKLDESILDSTIWREPHTTRITWVTMLAMKNQHGIVEASIPGLADRARVTIPEVQSALATLSAPDSFSRTKDFDGRRIREVAGGWLILNHQIYREKYSVEERRIYKRVNKQQERERKKSGPTDPPQKPPVDTCRQMSPMSPHTDADTDTENTTQGCGAFAGASGTGAYETASARIVTLNLLTGAKFDPPLHELDQVIQRLLEVKNDVAGVDAMLRRQVALWKNNPRMRNNLKPSTLFGPNFHDYYGQRGLPVDAESGPQKNGGPAGGTDRSELLQQIASISEKLENDPPGDEAAELEARLRSLQQQLQTCPNV